MSDESKRVSLTAPPDLIEELEAATKEWEYASRSEAFRDALRMFLSEYRWQHDLDRTQRGSIVVVYDHDTGNINDRLLELQHEVGDTIVATQHIHFDPHLCLETIVVNGPGTEIQELVNELRSLRGTKQVRLTIV
jgi:CopG family nickel-responsive transcriptional regulator